MSISGVTSVILWVPGFTAVTGWTRHIRGLRCVAVLTQSLPSVRSGKGGEKQTTP
jgi:hypothetical protein